MERPAVNPDQPPEPSGDPFIDEVRAMKRAAIARSGDDLERHIQRLREISERFRTRVVQPSEVQGTNAA